MKKKIAQLLRRLADRVSPQPTAHVVQNHDIQYEGVTYELAVLKFRLYLDDRHKIAGVYPKGYIEAERSTLRYRLRLFAGASVHIVKQGDALYGKLITYKPKVK